MIVLSKIGDEIDSRLGPDSPSGYEKTAGRQKPHVAPRLPSHLTSPPSPAPHSHPNLIQSIPLSYNGNALIWELYSAQAAHDGV